MIIDADLYEASLLSMIVDFERFHGWRELSVFKSICCSSRGPGFSSPSTQVVAHNSLIPVSESPMLWALHLCSTCRQNTHVLTKNTKNHESPRMSESNAYCPSEGLARKVASASCPGR